MSERVAFIHSYLSDKERKDLSGRYIPDRPTRLCILAAAELYRRGKVDIIALSVIPELSGPIITRLQSLLRSHLELKDIVSTNSSISTGIETREINRLLEENDWDQVVSICIFPHRKRVGGNAQRILVAGNKDRLRIVSADEVLINLDNSNRYRDVRQRSSDWTETRKIANQEKLVAEILKIPMIGPFLVYIFPDLLPGKIRFKTWLLTKLGE